MKLVAKWKAKGLEPSDASDTIRLYKRCSDDTYFVRFALKSGATFHFLVSYEAFAAQTKWWEINAGNGNDSDLSLNQKDQANRSRVLRVTQAAPPAELPSNKTKRNI